MGEKVSVIVPIYNVEKYLDKCIQSILNQTYTNLEVILVDDGSTDSCLDICNEYKKKDNRIKVIHASEVISTYEYSIGLGGTGATDFSYATAIGLFNSVINLIMITVVNRIASKHGDTSLW